MPAPPAQPDQAPDFPTSGSRGGRPRIPGRLAAAFSLRKNRDGFGDRGRHGGLGASACPPGTQGVGSWSWPGQGARSLGLCWVLGHSSFSPSTSQGGFNPFLHPQAILVPPSVFLPGTGITSGRAGTKDDFRSTFILPLFFFPPLLLAFFHPTFLSSWSSFPTSSPSRGTGVPSLSEGSLGGLVPCPVPSRGRWEWGGITPNWELRIFCKPAFFWEESPGGGQGCWTDSSCASSSAGIKGWDHTAPGAIPPPWKESALGDGEEPALDH